MAEKREDCERKNHMTIFFRNLGNNGRLFSCLDSVLSAQGFFTCCSNACYSCGCIHGRDGGKEVLEQRATLKKGPRRPSLSLISLVFWHRKGSDTKQVGNVPVTKGWILSVQEAEKSPVSARREKKRWNNIKEA